MGLSIKWRVSAMALCLVVLVNQIAICQTILVDQNVRVENFVSGPGNGVPPEFDGQQVSRISVTGPPAVAELYGSANSFFRILVAPGLPGELQFGALEPVAFSIGIEGALFFNVQEGDLFPEPQLLSAGNFIPSDPQEVFTIPLAEDFYLGFVVYDQASVSNPRHEPAFGWGRFGVNNSLGLELRQSVIGYDLTEPLIVGVPEPGVLTPVMILCAFNGLRRRKR